MESTIAALQKRYEHQAVRRAGELKTTNPPVLSSGFSVLDACTGCNGIPLGVITLLSGQQSKLPLTHDLAHKKLDRAVLDAYGWSELMSGDSINDKELLARLLALNLE